MIKFTKEEKRLARAEYRLYRLEETPRREFVETFFDYYRDLLPFKKFTKSIIAKHFGELRSLEVDLSMMVLADFFYEYLKFPKLLKKIVSKDDEFEMWLDNLGTVG